MAFRFCTNCGKPLTQEIPPLDNRVRDVCHACGTIHYENPKIVVCSIPYIKTARGIEVLLCLRAIEPRDNYWTLPGGFMETKETTEEAAVRETLEEAGETVSFLISRYGGEEGPFFYPVLQKDDKKNDPYRAARICFPLHNP